MMMKWTGSNGARELSCEYHGFTCVQAIACLIYYRWDKMTAVLQNAWSVSFAWEKSVVFR